MNFLRPNRTNGKPAAKSPGMEGDYKRIEPYNLGTPPAKQLPLHSAQQPPVHNTRDVLSHQLPPTTTPIYDQQIKLLRRHSQTITARASTDEPRVTNSNPSARTEAVAVVPLSSQAHPPIPERTPPASSLPLGAAPPITYGANPLGTHSNPQSPAGTQSPSQLWSNKAPPALHSKKTQPPTTNGVAPPLRPNGHASDNSVQYPNGRPGAEGPDNGGEGSIHFEERDKSWRGFFGTSKEREREKEAQKELTRMIGFLTATASDDWTLVLELCERASASESAAKEAAKALKQEFKYADPPAQLSAARLWAIMLRNSNNLFITQTASKKFMESVESVIISPVTSPVVRERLIEVLAAAAFTFHGPGQEGFQLTWKRVRPPNKPAGGIPFDMQDAMFDPTMTGRARTFTSPTPQGTYGNTPLSPPVHGPNTRRQDSDQVHGSRLRNRRDRELPQTPRTPQPPRRRDREYIPPEEDMRRLFEECEVALYNTHIFNEALAYATPDSFRSNSVIKEYYAKCQDSHALIIAQIPWASAGAARSQEKRDEKEKREGTPGAPGVTKEEKLLAALLNANQELVEAFKCYNDLEAAANAEKERRRGRVEQKADATQFQYISPEGVQIPDLTPKRPYSTSTSSREPSPSRGAGRSSNSRELPLPPSAFTTPAQPRFGHHHSQSSASVNSLMPPPPAPHGPRLPAPHRSRTPSPERQYAPPPQAPQATVAVSPTNAAAAVSFPTTSPLSGDPQYPIRHAPPPGPPPSHVHYSATREARIDSLRSVNSVSVQGHGVAPSMRVDVSAANSYASEVGEEEIMTPVRPSEKAMGKRRAPLDAEPDEEDLQDREETELKEAMLRSQSPYVDAEEEAVSVKKVQYVYDAAEERARQLAAEDAAERAALAAVRSRRSLDKPPTRTNSNQSSV